MQVPKYEHNGKENEYLPELGPLTGSVHDQPDNEVRYSGE